MKYQSDVDQQKGNERRYEVSFPTREDYLRVNTIGLCQSDQQCEMDYINFVHLGLKVKCLGGVCQSVF